MTARDVTVLFNKIVKKFGIEDTPEYLAPIPFFCKYGCKKPEKIVFLDGDGEEDGEEEEDESGIIKRLTMNDIQKWQACLIDFLIQKEDESVPGSYQNNDVMTAEFTPKNAFLVIEECKKEGYVPCSVFF